MIIVQSSLLKFPRLIDERASNLDKNFRRPFSEVIKLNISPIIFQATVGKDIDGGKQTQAETSSIHRIRIVLTACNVRSLEKVCADLISGAKKQKLRVKVSFLHLILMFALTWGAFDIYRRLP